jgi:hypothetical protein
MGEKLEICITEKASMVQTYVSSLWCKHVVLSLQLGSVKQILEPSKLRVLFLSCEVPRNAAGAK